MVMHPLPRNQKNNTLHTRLKTLKPNLNILKGGTPRGQAELGRQPYLIQDTRHRQLKYKTQHRALD